MTNSDSEKTGPEQSGGTDGTVEGIDDSQLPEDLQPSEDNPLAEPLEEGSDTHSVDELDMQGGKTPEESDGDSADGTEGDGAAGDGDRDGS